MNRGKAAFDRIITFLLFLIFAALATWGICLALDLPAAHTVGDYADRSFWRGLPDRDNYRTILTGTAVVLFLIGIVLLAVNIERKRLHRIVSPTSGTTGVITVHPADVASAVAQTIETVPDVRSTSYRAVEDRSTQVIEIRVRIPAESDIRRIHAACNRAAQDIAESLPGSPVRPRFILQVEQVQRGR
ncbi:hypothetical protein [Corynebacterium nuruki]|jgi:hypothetical protein|uniref:Alkaline shock response membrane anchor protein AmaP n=1 Tax=Corynebacterium nuruki TaxID=1032851 RepID=A0A3D4T003_9CORY|nr:hypothetical protein [Corynebacterium nuruki]HCT14862.1 hypothetical protein [Corynebacterium nuruki]